MVVGMKLSPRRDRQVVRILGLLKTLAEGGRPTVHQIAARFNTLRETIYRDLYALEGIGYPVRGDESGRLSRPRLAPEARPTLPPVALTRQETPALVCAAKQAGRRQPFHAVLPTALAKLQALAAGREGRLAFAIDWAVGGRDRGVKDFTTLEPMILRLVEAIVSGRRCKVEYQAPSQGRPRRFLYDPYRPLSVHGGLYCVGRVPPTASEELGKRRTSEP